MKDIFKVNSTRSAQQNKIMFLQHCKALYEGRSKAWKNLRLYGARERI